MSAPLVVNTKDGTCWTRRTVTASGLALYAPEGVCKCPEFVMATLAELAEHGIVGSADVLPVPVGPEPLVDDHAKAPWGRGEDGRPLLPLCAHWTDVPELVDQELARIRGRLDQAQSGNWHLALASEGRPPGTVRTNVNGYQRTVGRVANMLPGDLDLVLHAHADLSWCLEVIAKVRARVAELEAERHSTNEALDDAANELRARKAAPVTIYRAEHPDSGITLGHYGTEDAARRHCETTERRSWPTGTTLAFGWIRDALPEDEENGVAELVVTAGQNEESVTGYIVTALEVPSEYDEEADE